MWYRTLTIAILLLMLPLSQFPRCIPAHSPQMFQSGMLAAFLIILAPAPSRVLNQARIMVLIPTPLPVQGLSTALVMLPAQLLVSGLI